MVRINKPLETMFQSMEGFPLDKEHQELEALTREAFPTAPLPALEWDHKTAFSRQMVNDLAGKTWVDAIGEGLYRRHMCVWLSSWLTFLPLAVTHYFLPSHLLYAAQRLSEQPEVADQDEYASGVMEALILPPANRDELDALQDELYMLSFLEETSVQRAALYELMTPEQRQCVARFLGIYLAYNERCFGPYGIELYVRNQMWWERSSYPFVGASPTEMGSRDGPGQVCRR